MTANDFAREAGNAPYARRFAVRALLFNPRGELLLTKYRGTDAVHVLGAAPVLENHWGTLGGGVEPGEELAPALQREIAEETGHKNIRVGAQVWHRRAGMMFKGAPLLLDERYFIAHTDELEIRTDNYTEFERSYLLETRWWPVAEVAATREIILPRFLPSRIAAIAAGAQTAGVETFSDGLEELARLTA